MRAPPLPATRALATALLLACAAVLAGCASSYDLTLMPRHKGTLYKGEAYRPAGSDEAQVNILIDGKGYSGTWVVTAPEYGSGYVSAGIGFGHRHGGLGIATVPVIVDHAGREAKALLRSADGSGLRCDLKGIAGGSGSGTCQDDQGILYDVQVRLRENK